MWIALQIYQATRTGLPLSIFLRVSPAIPLEIYLTIYLRIIILSMATCKIQFVKISLVVPLETPYRIPSIITLEIQLDTLLRIKKKILWNDRRKY